MTSPDSTPRDSGSAPGERAVRILTFNIRHGEGIDDVLDLERTARVIESTDADVVTLQEVDRHFGGRSRFQDQTWWLGRRLGMTALYGPDMTLPPPDVGRPRREYGNAILTRHQVEWWDHVPLPAWPGMEERGVLRASLLLGESSVTVWTTHLAHENPELRAEQARAVVRTLPGSPRGLVLTGDLNDVPESATLKELTGPFADAWPLSHTELGGTFDSVSRSIRIDYILATADIGVTAVDLVEVGDASDHLALVADLTVPAG
ncbi:endonuclease/exonuclease/phosphatase family protein [Phytoactinopolyspora endophytica]|uniref:endonuclease/exonuclease/phosphatase family protein n=1 Tax=Phytoactinopolyspora endophytica TaxID=1642495 RepID=UPI00101DEB0F|nr:endonuclease/exonuclease/phosphatase family protein [Phytoactinopolyspora endophytica]